jgi:quinoprotein glucose dehydrogenase
VPVEERPVPVSDVPGEQSWPTQPFPVEPPPLVPQRLTEDDLWHLSDRHVARCRDLLRGLRNDGLFTPPSERGTLLYPFTAGGANWSAQRTTPAATSWSFP